MALAISNVLMISAGSEMKATALGAADNSYPTNGYEVNAASFGLGKITRLKSQSEGGYVLESVPTSDPAIWKLKFSRTAGATPTFTGTAPKSSSLYTVTHDATPDGNAIYVKFNESGPYLACNMATDTADKVITFANSEKLTIKHDASAGTGGVQVYFDSDGATVSARLLIVSPTTQDVYVRCHSGSVVRLVHDASAATNGNAITYDDGTDERIESNCSTAADATISTHTSAWVTDAPAGSNSVSAAALTEVSNGTNLSSLTAIEIEAYGYF